MKADTDRGAALIMALIFLTVGSLLVVSVANLSGSNLLNTSAVQAQRNAEYAADAAVGGAIQSVRYHGSCENFPKTTSIQISTFNVFVSCSGTPITKVQVSGTTVTLNGSSSASTFVPEDVGQQVYDANIGNGGFTSVTAYVNPTTLTIASGASATDGNAVVGNEFQRVDLFSGCVSTSSLTSCSPSNAVVTAVVHFDDTDASGNPAPGFNMVILRWTVNSANG